MGEIELKPEQIAYAALWRLTPGTPALNDTRLQLLDMIGGLRSDGQRQAMQWAAEHFQPVSEAEILSIDSDAPSDTGGDLRPTACVGPICKRTDGVVCADWECDNASGVYEPASPPQVKVEPVAWVGPYDEITYLHEQAEQWAADGGKVAAYFSEPIVEAFQSESSTLQATIDSLTRSLSFRATAWRDIESAPKDGTEILLWKGRDYGVVIGRWTSSEAVDPEWDGECEFECWFEGEFGWLEDDLTPDLWMPLPAPPHPGESA